MAKELTQHQRICRGLQVLGYKRVEQTQVRRYAVYTMPGPISTNNKGRTFFFVGKMGALRLGSSVAGSIPMSDAARMQILQAGGEA